MKTKYLIQRIRLAKDALNTKVADGESKIPDITNLGTNAALNTKATETENEMHNTKGFITSLKLNRLIKIGFDARKQEAAKRLASKCQVDNAPDIVGKNRAKIVKL